MNKPIKNQLAQAGAAESVAVDGRTAATVRCRHRDQRGEVRCPSQT